MDLTGKVTSGSVFVLKFPSGGKLDYLDCRVGQMVKKGHLLARLDQSKLQVYLDRSLKRYGQVRAEFDERQTKKLDEYGKRKFQAELDVSVKNVEIAKENLENTNLYAPVAGMIVEVDPGVAGMNITPAGFTVTLLDPASFYFQASVSEVDLSKVKTGVSVSVSLKSMPGSVIAGKIERIGFVVGKGGKFPVAISLANKADLRLGLTGVARLS